MRRRLVLVALSAVAAACSTAPPPPPIEVSAEPLEGECRLRAEGRAMTIDELTAAARKWRGRKFHLDMDVTTPYKCVGAAVYALQRAGVKRIGFIAEPPPAAAEEK